METASTTTITTVQQMFGYGVQGQPKGKGGIFLRNDPGVDFWHVIESL
jgi:hypothetical protein